VFCGKDCVLAGSIASTPVLHPCRRSVAEQPHVHQAPVDTTVVNDPVGDKRLNANHGSPSARFLGRV
jgi:hypothetical protein